MDNKLEAAEIAIGVAIEHLQKAADILARESECATNVKRRIICTQSRYDIKRAIRQAQLAHGIFIPLL